MKALEFSDAQKTFRREIAGKLHPPAVQVSEQANTAIPRGRSESADNWNSRSDNVICYAASISTVGRVRAHRAPCVKDKFNGVAPVRALGEHVDATISCS